MPKLTRDKYLLEPEYKKLIYQARVRQHVNAKRDRAILVVGGGAGLRVKEIISIRAADLLFKEKPPLLRVTNAKKRDGLHQEDLPVPASVVAAVKEYMLDQKKKGRVFEAWERIFPLTTRQAERIFKRYASLAGLNPRYSIHSLRHFRALFVYDKTRDIQLTKDALRHASIVSTMVYTHLVDRGRIAQIDIEGDS